MQRLRDVALVLVFSFSLVSPLDARQVTPVPGGIMLNFRSVPLGQVFEALAQAISTNIVLSDIPDTPITLRTFEPVALNEVRGLIVNLAEANGVALSESGGFLRLSGRAPEAAPDLRELYIYPLRHARAATLAGTLQALFGATGATTTTGTGGRGGAAGGPAGNTLSQRLQQLEQQAAAAAAPIIGQQGGAIVLQARPGSGDLQAPVHIVPDEVTNSLLIRATPTDWLVVQQALQQLDLRPLQVVIEVVIAEVSRTDDLDVGVSWFTQEGSEETGDLTGGGVRQPDPAEGTFTLRVLRSGSVDIDATLAALATTGRVRIVSRPVIHAQNNQQAFILVGSERPFIAVSRSLPTDAVRDDVIQYLSVGTVLTIVPTINNDGYVNLLVSQEVSSATTETQFGAPVISTREAETQILARNGQTVVIGGLVDHQVERTRSGIPILKDIPLLGWLFGRTRYTTGNSELFLFLTPFIVSTDDDADRVREEIENRSELLEELVPIEPRLPPVPAPGDPVPVPVPAPGVPAPAPDAPAPDAPAPDAPPAGTP